MWVLHGYRTLRGKEAFDREIENDAAVGGPTLHLKRLIEEGDIVVAVGTSEMTIKEAGRVGFVFAEVFTFTGDRISRLETFHINLGRPATPCSASRLTDEAAAGLSSTLRPAEPVRRRAARVVR